MQAVGTVSSAAARPLPVRSQIQPRAPTGCRHSGLPDLELLLAHGAKLGATDANGLTALHYAARTDYGLEVAEPLLAWGADVNARDNAGRMPLDHALELGLERMPQFLTGRGGKPSR
jgi:ankyrin repeat protein